MFQELAFQIAKKAHSKQVDKAGKDYILHPMKVASYMDTDSVITLTHRKDESYFEYISRVSTSKLAKKVKVADLLHNLDITRIKEPTKQDYQRLEKYKKAILYLATH